MYLQPDVTTDHLRRGRMLRLVAKDTPVVAERSDWRVNETASYAYIPLSGPAGEVSSEQDLAWPFEVHEEIDDETLISLVTFVRSKPPIPGVPEGQFPRQVVSAPLSRVWRQGDEFIVALRPSTDAEVFGVTLIRKGGQWVVTKWTWAIA